MTSPLLYRAKNALVSHWNTINLSVWGYRIEVVNGWVRVVPSCELLSKRNTCSMIVFQWIQMDSPDNYKDTTNLRLESVWNCFRIKITHRVVGISSAGWFQNHPDHREPELPDPGVHDGFDVLAAGRAQKLPKVFCCSVAVRKFLKTSISQINGNWTWPNFKLSPLYWSGRNGGKML